MHHAVCYDVSSNEARSQRRTAEATVITFRVTHSRCEMYIRHDRLCVCRSVPRRIPTLLQGPGYNLGEW